MLPDATYNTYKGGHYYIQKPTDDEWNQKNKSWLIVLAKKNGDRLESLCDSSPRLLNPSEWTICNLAAQILTDHLEYVRLYHYVDPTMPVPKKLVEKVKKANERNIDLISGMLNAEQLMKRAKAGLPQATVAKRPT